MMGNVDDHDAGESSHSKKVTGIIGSQTRHGWELALSFPDREEETGVRPVCPQVSHGGLVQFNHGQLTVGGYAGLETKGARAFGTGGYLTLSWSGCH
jgi:hypothetical protein